MIEAIVSQTLFAIPNVSTMSLKYTCILSGKSLSTLRSIWSPYMKQDMEKLEKVQIRAMTMIQGYKYLSYEERSIRFGLTTLEKKRSRGDLIEAYKIITGKESIQLERFFELAPSKVTRGTQIQII